MLFDYDGDGKADLCIFRDGTWYVNTKRDGTLQAIFEYQTAICELTGMDVSNASGYDGTTVAAMIMRADLKHTDVTLIDVRDGSTRVVWSAPDRKSVV